MRDSSSQIWLEMKAEYLTCAKTKFSPNSFSWSKLGVNVIPGILDSFNVGQWRHIATFITFGYNQDYIFNPIWVLKHYGDSLQINNTFSSLNFGRFGSKQTVHTVLQTWDGSCGSFGDQVNSKPVTLTANLINWRGEERKREGKERQYATSI